MGIPHSDVAAGLDKKGLLKIIVVWWILGIRLRLKLIRIMIRECILISNRIWREDRLRNSLSGRLCC